MLKHKKSLILIAAIIMAVTAVLTGCGKDSSKDGETTATGQKTTTAEQQATTAAPTETKKDPVTIIWYAPGDDQSNPEPVYEEVNKLLLDKYNLKLDFRTFPFGTYDEKISMIISSREEYDLCFTTQAWLNKYPVQVSRDAFLALDDYLPNYPDLIAAIPENILEQMRERGKIYAIPNYQISYSQWGLFFRKDLIEESGFDYKSIKTYMDAEPFWRWVVENRPEFFPTQESWQNQLEDVDHEWIDVVHDAVFRKGDPTYKLTMMDEKEESMANRRGPWYLGTRNRMMWEKGYLRKDSPTVVDENPDRAAGRYASFAGVVKPGGEAEVSERNGAEYVQVALEKPYSSMSSTRAAMTAVNAMTKHPEEAIKMLEIAAADAEFVNLLNFGIEGVNYNMVNNRVERVPDSGYFYNAVWTFGNQFLAKLMPGQPDDVWEETDRLNRESEVSPVNGFSFNNENVVNEIANVSAVRKEFARWNFMDNYEEIYDETLAKLKAAGRDKILEEIQRQLNDWVKANK